VSSELFDFDYWKNLAEKNPAEFFLARQRLIDDFIASAPAEMKEGLLVFQSNIDCARVEAASPLKAVRAIVGMIGDHLDALQCNLSRLRDESAAIGEMLDQAQR